MTEFDIWENKLITKLNNSNIVKNNNLNIGPVKEKTGIEIADTESSKYFIAVENYKVFFNKIAFVSYPYNKSLNDASNYLTELISNWLNL